MEWGSVHKSWEKWASANVGYPGMPLKGALLANYDPSGPSRLLSTISCRLSNDWDEIEEEGMKVSPLEFRQFMDFVKSNKLQSESFVIGTNEYIVTSIHENWFSARCINTSNRAGEGAIAMQTATFLLVALYDGSIGAASRAMAAVDHFASQLGQRNL